MSDDKEVQAYLNYSKLIKEEAKGTSMSIVKSNMQ